MHVGKETYIARAVALAGAVVLVDEDGVGHAVHGDPREGDVLDEAGVGHRPRLDPQAVGRARQHRLVHRHVPHPLLTVLPSQAPDAATVHPTQTQDQCYLSNAAQITSKQNIKEI